MHFSVSLLLYSLQHPLIRYKISSGKETQRESVNFFYLVPAKKIRGETAQMMFMATACNANPTGTGSTSIKSCCSETSRQLDQRQPCVIHRKRNRCWIKKNFKEAGLLFASEEISRETANRLPPHVSVSRLTS